MCWIVEIQPHQGDFFIALTVYNPISGKRAPCFRCVYIKENFVMFDRRNGRNENYSRVMSVKGICIMALIFMVAICFANKRENAVYDDPVKQHIYMKNKKLRSLCTKLENTKRGENSNIRLRNSVRCIAEGFPEEHMTEYVSECIKDVRKYIPEK